MPGTSIPPRSSARLLRGLSEREVCGELVVVTDTNVEMHVYLLDGRLAWATCTSMRSVFTRYLATHCGVETQKLRAIIEECQREHRRLGDALVATTPVRMEDIRSALLEQIRQVLALWDSVGKARVYFLERRLVYERHLTFSLDEVIETAAASQASADLILRRIAAATWSAVVDSGDLQSFAARDSGRQLWPRLLDLAEMLHATRLESLTLRSPFGVLLGQRCQAGDSSLWCAIQSHEQLGFASAVLGTLARPDQAHVSWPSTGRASAALAVEIDAVADPSLPVSVAPVQHALREEDALLAGLVLSGGDGRMSFAGRATHAQSALLEVVGALEPLLARSVVDAFLSPDAPERVELDDRPALRAQHGNEVFYGTELPGAARLSLWCVSTPSAPQGLGWAWLSTLAHQVVRAEPGETALRLVV